MTWTHQGKPLGQPQRPWRLTRAQRVEMEAALARLRGNVRTVPDADGWYSSETVEVARVLGVHTMEAVNDGLPESVFRARLAIALRAALRADEDARCEEAEGRVGLIYDEADFERAEMRASALDSCDELREWPRVSRTEDGVRIPLVEVSPHLKDYEWAAHMYVQDRMVPLALWEVEERRRRETVRVVVALLTWGLS